MKNSIKKKQDEKEMELKNRIKTKQNEKEMELTRN